MSSPLEESLWQQIVAAELPWPQREVRFCKRRWRWDFAYEHLLLAIEVQGGTWCKSTHGGGARQTQSFEKLNSAALLGWRIFYVNAEMIENGMALALIQRAIAVPTLIAGVYGMNSEFMPELHWHWAYPVVGGAMVIAGLVIMYVWPGPWDQRTLVLEMVEIGLFATMWVVQSVERWGKILQARR